ncbi:hypothetical protein ROD_40821 [Citrobacter rodentium ICC168]|uniref:Uncharacterized protein n=1 Tax=Citrobacter rodentium (strain ICC168) TaxID=637910 RepID=D2TI10_CITRI|nr:hypothetical protein ROD_40821 [Citrobacter rodentium ICC168]
MRQTVIIFHKPCSQYGHHLIAWHLEAAPQHRAQTPSCRPPSS